MLRLHRSGVSAPHAKRMSLSSFHNVHRIEQVVTLPNACFPVTGFAFTAMRAHSASSSRNWERKPVNFTDTSIFREHSSTELLRGLVVFRLCRMRQLVLWSVPLLTKIELILGEHLTYNTLVKWTFFKHFCAGTDEIEIRPSLAKLRRVGIGPILDYAAEADSVEDAPKESGKTASTLEVDMYKVLHRANIQYRADGALYDETCEKFIKCIVHASQNKLPSGLAFAAVKVTGLCDPQLLVRVTALLLYVRRIWLRLFYGNEEAIEKKQRLQDARVREKTNLPLEHFIREILHIVPTMSVDEAKAVGKRFDTMNKGNVEFVDFTFIMGNMLVGSNPKPDPVLDPFIKNMPRLSDRERELMIETRRRADALAQKATELGVRVMFDAEQTFYQKAIDHLVRELQRKYNQTEPVVYNTYQAYMKITDERVRNDLQRAERQNWVWGGKLVRGAYLEQEAALAQRFRYENPICSSKKATDTSYDLCVERILKYINVHPGTKLGVLFGTHNLSSLQLATQRITEIQHTHRKEYEVSFAQLYGMGDHLTFPIAKAGFSAFKYVPYGKVKETVSYLYRRALENSAMLSSPTNENNFIIEELKGRAFFWKKRDGIKRE